LTERSIFSVSWAELVSSVEGLPERFEGGSLAELPAPVESAIAQAKFDATKVLTMQQVFRTLLGLSMPTQCIPEVKTLFYQLATMDSQGPTLTSRVC